MTTTTPLTPSSRGRLGRSADTIRTRLTLPATFNFDWIRSFLTLRRVPSLERWTDDDVYIRSVCIDGASALLTIRYVTAPGTSWPTCRSPRAARATPR